MAEVNAIVIEATGDARIEYVTPDLETLKGIVGGYLEGVSAIADTGHGNWHGYVDEEGKLKNLPRNYVADEVLTALGWGGRVAGDFIVGPLILLGDGKAGEEADVPDATLQFVLAYFREHGQVVTD